MQKMEAIYMQLLEEGRGDELATEGNNCGLGCGAVRVCFVKGLQKKGAQYTATIPILASNSSTKNHKQYTI